MKKVLWILCLGFAFGTVGCATDRDTIFSFDYVKRHVKKMDDSFYEFRKDIDRTIFDLDDRPLD